MAVTAVDTEARRTGPLHETQLQLKRNTWLDELFRSSPAGDRPEGDLLGSAIVFPGSKLAVILARIAYRVAWQGKVADADRQQLVNKISPLRLRAIRAKVYPGASWVDGEPCIVIDYSDTSFVARMVRDEIRLVDVGFYLGVVWVWRRRVAWFTLRSQTRR
jgi:hypothetical protein